MELAPRTPDPNDAPPLRWGILGTGLIAGAFADALRLGTRQELAVVGSRTLERATSFASAHSVAAAVGSYEELVAADVDVIYVASPHSEHVGHSLLALRAGKPVLVEKAFTRNASEAKQVFAEAQARDLFVMEAMWSRFLPHYDLVRQLLDAGALGEVVAVHADHGQKLWPDGPQRLSDPALAGGALLDLGVYPVSFARMVLGEFATINAVATLTPEGVDAQVSAIVTTATGAHGTLTATMAASTATTAVVVGTEARVELDGPFYAPTTVRLVAPDGSVRTTWRGDRVEGHHGLRYQAAEVARCLSNGHTESALMTHADTLAVMEHGRIVEDGTPDDLVAGGDGRYSDLHRAWVESLA